MNNSKIIKSTTCLFIIFSMILGNIVPIFAASTGDTVDIVCVGESEYNVYYKYAEGVNSLIHTYYVGYYENGQLYPCYCLEVSKPRR
ncbi:MAG: hypothetical protein ACI4UX_03765 [Clostridia bacterium]